MPWTRIEDSILVLRAIRTSGHSNFGSLEKRKGAQAKAIRHAGHRRRQDEDQTLRL